MATVTPTAAAAEPARRNFYDEYEAEQMPASATPSAAADSAAASSSTAAGDAKSALLRYIDRSVVGKHTCLQGPWGWRRIVYADWTASGKPLSFIEDYLRSEVAPFYANTHTTSTVTGLQSSLFRREARDIVKRCLRGNKDDALLFCGSGATAALKTLVHVLALPARARAHAAAGHTGPSLVVLLGPYEHHSNILPWREAGAQCVWVRESPAGGVDMDDLNTKASELARAHPHALRVGAFSAASNVSGILTDTDAVTRALHRAGFLAFWDYAGAAPYVEIDANPGGNDASVAKDAIFLSPHKLVGGPSTPGVLLLKKSLCVNRVPATPGGGTVFFVTDEAHRYLENFEEREEGGTQDILASVRAGLVFQLKEQVVSQHYGHTWVGRRIVRLAGSFHLTDAH
jgi:selenocysteine lyase/cysteine desulfurase